MPIVTLIAVRDAKLGSKQAKEVVGTKIGTTEEWKKLFFANQKDLCDQLHDFEPGDYVNVIMEQTPDKKYWNIKEFKDVTDEEIEKATRYAKGGKPTGGTGESVRRADGGSRGDDTNRSAAVYLARDIVNNVLMQQGGYGTMSCVDATCMMIELADKYVYPYIKDGAVAVAPHLEKKRKPRKESTDPLAPPEE